MVGDMGRGWGTNVRRRVREVKIYERKQRGEEKGEDLKTRQRRR